MYRYADVDMATQLALTELKKQMQMPKEAGWEDGLGGLDWIGWIAYVVDNAPAGSWKLADATVGVSWIRLHIYSSALYPRRASETVPRAEALHKSYLCWTGKTSTCRWYLIPTTV